MKSVKVLIPFHNAETKVDQVPGDVIEVSDTRLAEIQKVNVNMVQVLGEVLGEVEKKTTKKTTKKAE